jgi:hypothetical protein
MALRAGLRRGEHVAVQWADIQFGRDEHDRNRFVVVAHNYVRREHTTTKSKKIRRVDMSRELRRVLIELRDKRLLESFLNGKNDISTSWCFRHRTAQSSTRTISIIETSGRCSRRPDCARSDSMISGNNHRCSAAFHPSLHGWFGTTKLTRAWEPALLWIQLPHRKFARSSVKGQNA